MNTIKAPWVLIEDKLPEEAKEVLWMDVDGCFHLGPLRGLHVMPAVYGNADEVLRPLRTHICWQEITAPVTP
ncbi:TPA: hypothetical protein ACYRLJ_000261 [Pseudomonas aeruginosa]